MTAEQLAQIQKSLEEVEDHGYGEVRIVFQDGEAVIYQEIKTKKVLDRFFEEC